MAKSDGGTGSSTYDEVIAGEYVLGALSPDAARQVETRLRTDRQFAAIVRRWQENLADAGDEYAEPWGVVANGRLGNGMPLAANFPSLARAGRFGPALRLGLWVVFLGLAAVYVFSGPAGGPAAQQPDVAASPLSALYDAEKGQVEIRASLASVPLTRVWLIETSGTAHLLGDMAAGSFIALTPEMRQMMAHGADLALSSTD